MGRVVGGGRGEPRGDRGARRLRYVAEPEGVGSGGIYAFIIIGILCQVALFFYDGKLGPVLSVGAAVLYALAFGFSVSGGVGNITDYFTGVVCFGIPALAPLNFVIAALLLISTILSIVVCFMRREKSE